jgi:hypothetical protein
MEICQKNQWKNYALQQNIDTHNKNQTKAYHLST